MFISLYLIPVKLCFAGRILNCYIGFICEANMLKSELINIISNKQQHLTLKDVDLAVDCIIETMSQALIANDRIEIRGFGAFTLHYHRARLGRNPKTGESLNLSAKYALRFKPGKELRDRVNGSILATPIIMSDE